MQTNSASFGPESEMLQLEETFKDEQAFIDKFAMGDAKDVIVLNVSGDIMVTTWSTLQTAEDSVLAQQFDNSKWTEQGCNTQRVKEWMPDQVTTWVRDIKASEKTFQSSFTIMKSPDENYLPWVVMKWKWWASKEQELCICCWRRSRSLKSLVKMSWPWLNTAHIALARYWTISV